MAAYISGIIKLNSQFFIEYPRPDVAPIISAATSTSMACVAPRRSPTMMEGKEEGSTTFLKMEKSPEPMELADFINRGSTLFTPLMVFSRMGHCVPQYITAIFEISPIPKNSKNTGKRDSDETCLMVCTRLSDISSKPLYHPIKNPSGIMVITASPNPVNARCRLIPVCIPNSPVMMSFAIAAETSEGEERNVLFTIPNAGSSSHASKRAIRAVLFLIYLYGIL